MRSYILASLATAAAAAAAANTQIPFFLPGMRAGDSVGIDPVASIIKADASTTVMALACPTGTDDTECGWGSNDLTVSVIAKTEYAVSVPSAQVSFDCTSKKDMTCTAAIAQEFTDAGLSGFTAGGDGIATGTTVYASSEIALQTATVTAGQEKLSGGAAAMSTTATATASAASAAKETGAKETGASSTLKTTGSAASTGVSPSSTGGNGTGTSVGPAQNTGAASSYGVAFAAIAGAAAAYVL